VGRRKKSLLSSTLTGKEAPTGEKACTDVPKDDAGYTRRSLHLKAKPLVPFICISSST
jgi:hypothetical protein